MSSRAPTLITWAAAVVLAAITCTAASAQVEALPPAIKVDVTTAPSAVSVYRGRAAITRTALRTLDPGVNELTFGSLPETIRPESLQARIRGPATVLGVDFTIRPAASDSNPRVVELDRRIELLQLAQISAEEDLELNAAEEAFVDGIATKAATEAGGNAGTPGLSVDEVRQQLAFIAEERSRLMERRRVINATIRDLDKRLDVLRRDRDNVAGAPDAVDRVAVVTLMVLARSAIEIDLIHLVTDATWEPIYNIRADRDGGRVTIEYEALLTQRTGEDWPDVALTFSTSRPTEATSPPALEPWFVDIVEPGAPSARARLARGPDLEAAASEAVIGGAGPAVTYTLPRRVSAPSDRQRQHRLRIATIDSRPTFLHVAMPALTEDVYIRGALTNNSSYQMLAGTGAIFVGQDFVGPAIVGAVAPGTSFDLYFGVDRTVTTRRVRLDREESKTGLLGGGVRTTSAYRIEIDNNAGKSILLELWDRIPITRTEKIAVELLDLSQLLDTDLEYVEVNRPQGMLRWTLPVPATPLGQPFVVSYTVRVTHAKDVDITPLPD